jgi:uncharacterized membrane-anchored protein YitT (DUF2179 family)
VSGPESITTGGVPLGHAPAPPRRLRLLPTLLLYVGLTAAVTWPQVLQVSSHVADVGDPLLNTWALAWVAHQMPFAPAHLFDANIFHPERRTLAYSETLIAPALLGAPLLWLGAGPVQVYNLLFLAGFAFSGLTMAWLVFELTGRTSAALVGGAIFAFLPWRFDHYSHFQLLQTQWMPLALLGLHRTLTRGRLSDGVLMGASVGLQALTSMYNAVFLGLFLVPVALVLLRVRQVTRRTVAAIAASLVIASLLAAPAVIAHLKAREVVGERSRGEAEANSAVWSNFLSSVPNSKLHGGWSQPFGDHERRLFPGFVALLLALVAAWPPVSRARLAYVVGGLAAADLALGFNGWLYPLVYDQVVALRGLRVPARMGLLVGAAVAVLAGFAVARLVERMSVRAERVLAAALIAGVLTDVWVAPLVLTPVADDAPLIYFDMLRDKGDPPRTTLARQASDPRPAVLLELPIERDAPTYMYYSTFHWQTLVNGYSGFFSGRYIELSNRLRHFPAEDATALLGSLGVRYLTVHGELLSPRDYRRIIDRLDRMAPQFRLVNRRPWQGAEISLYRVTHP